MNQLASSNSNKGTGGRPRYIDGTHFEVGQEVLKTAFYVIEPDEQTQRKAFAELMPQLYALRNKGCSWNQLARLLLECDINLQPSSVKAYYGEMLATRMDACQLAMNSSLLSLAQARKETQAQVTPAIENRADKIQQLAQQRLAVMSNTERKEPPIAAAKKATAAPSSITPAAPSAAPTNPQPAQPKASPVEIAVVLDGGKSAGQSQDTTPPSKAGSLTCRPLQKGVAALKKREGVADIVYVPGDLEHPDAHFSDRGRLFQANRGRRFSAIVDAQRMRASEKLNVSQLTDWLHHLSREAT